MVQHPVNDDNPQPGLPEDMKCTRCGTVIHAHLVIAATTPNGGIAFCHAKMTAGGTQPVLCGPVVSD